MAQDGTSDVTTIKSSEDFDDSAEGWAQRWDVEFEAAKKEITKWWNRSDKIVKRLLDKRMGDRAEMGDNYKLNLYASNVQTMRAFLYGNAPSVVVTRRFADAADDDARVAGEILERCLNSDLSSDSDTYNSNMSYALDDRLTVGMGNCKVRYEAEFDDDEVEIEAILDDEGNELAPAYSETQATKTREEARTDYMNWRDQLWSPCRTFREMRWWAFCTYLTKDQATKEFGEDVAKKLPYSKQGTTEQKGAETWHRTDGMKNDPWSRAQIWEVWDKDNLKVDWYCRGYKEVLKSEPDPLGLEGFWPIPMPMMANLTTSSFMPLPDYLLVQDVFEDYNVVSLRIRLLVKAMKVVGVYDSSEPSLKRLLGEGFDNDLIPVANWGALMEKGGISGVLSFMPLEGISGALDKLRDYRNELKSLIDELTGMGDIIRGAAEYVGSGPQTAAEATIKSKFASVRIQSMKDDFARFASDVQKLKAEIICKHFSAETIFERSNIKYTYDLPTVQKAMALLKSDFINYRIEVKSETLAMQDFTKQKNERTQVIEALSNLVTSAGPLIQTQPELVPFIGEMMKWQLASFQGSSEIQGEVDQFIEAFKQKIAQAAAQPQQPQQDPKAQAQAMQAQAQLQKQQMDSAAKMQSIITEGQVDQARIKSETDAQIATEAAKAQFATEREAATERLKQQGEASKEFRSMAAPVPPTPRPA